MKHSLSLWDYLVLIVPARGSTSNLYSQLSSSQHEVSQLNKQLWQKVRGTVAEAGQREFSWLEAWVPPGHLMQNQFSFSTYIDVNNFLPLFLNVIVKSWLPVNLS